MLLLITLLILNILLREYIKQSNTKFSKILFLIGIPLHEAAHYFIARLTLRKIVHCKFIPNFNMSPPAYVIYKNGSSIGSKIIDLLIGMAPLYLGAIAIYFIGPEPTQPNPYVSYFLRWLVVLAIAQCMLPSWQDIKNSIPGILIFSIPFALIYALLNIELSISDDNIREFQIVLTTLVTYQMIGVAFIKLRMIHV
ncbi:hypothetical protein CWC26_17060 [Pseudoalteromonas sp. S4488]|uniref:hypothetical protein n=1 Tax=Pseudoalteromonas sp. S4488 TaxID=579558 RepID=UPI0011098FD5|nr:hypothetical protein [Pseudoalteromonas sp. S4488]TMO35992.1 hypothetical protein CWC26_17060 [Pseudoalteromonas sp. S4488]